MRKLALGIPFSFFRSRLVFGNFLTTQNWWQPVTIPAKQMYKSDERPLEMVAESSMS